MTDVVLLFPCIFNGGDITPCRGQKAVPGDGAKSLRYHSDQRPSKQIHSVVYDIKISWWTDYRKHVYRGCLMWKVEDDEIKLEKHWSPLGRREVL